MENIEEEAIGILYEEIDYGAITLKSSPDKFDRISISQKNEVLLTYTDGTPRHIVVKAPNFSKALEISKFLESKKPMEPVCPEYKAPKVNMHTYETR